MSVPLMEVENATKIYNRDAKETIAIKDINFTVNKGEFISIVGPSGCGKTTLLEILSGLRTLTSGAVKIKGKTVTEPNPSIGIVFQEESTFPWRTLLENIVNGYKVADGIRALIVPGSQKVKKQAEEEGLSQIFMDAGFEWREAGCSMCLGMNPDFAKPGERVASTSNRNFEGRQGRDSRTHLVSPPMAAAAAIKGHFVDVRNWPVKIREEV